jgi:hypothetical protein
MAKAKLPVRVREALDKSGWQEINSTSGVASFRRPLSSLLIQPSPRHKGRYVILIDFTDKRSSITEGVDEDTLIKYLTTDDRV